MPRSRCIAWSIFTPSRSLSHVSSLLANGGRQGSRDDDGSPTHTAFCGSSQSTSISPICARGSMGSSSASSCS